MRLRTLLTLSCLLSPLSLSIAHAQPTVGSILVGDATGVARCASYSGAVTREIIEYQDGDDHYTHLRPGRNKTSRVTIEKDWSSTKEFRQYIQGAMDGSFLKRKSISIIFMDRNG